MRVLSGRGRDMGLPQKWDQRDARGLLARPARPASTTGNQSRNGNGSRGKASIRLSSHAFICAQTVE